MSVDIFANAMIHIKNSDFVAKKECIVKPTSKLIIATCTLFKDLGYIGAIEHNNDKKGGSLKIKLLGKINECKAIKPRYSVAYRDFEKYEKRYLPSKDIGYLIVSTTKGIMTHREAKKNKIGGKLIAYIY